MKLKKVDYFYVIFLKCLVNKFYCYFINLNNDNLIYMRYTLFFNNIILFLKKNSLLQCFQFIDFSVIDYPFLRNRFVLIYNIFSVSFNIRVLCKMFIQENTYVTSLDSIFLGAN